MFGIRISKRPIWLWPILTFLLLQFCGGILYFFRPETPLFLQGFGVHTMGPYFAKLPDWMVYNLPDGLYCFSFLGLIKAIWISHPMYSHFFCALFYIACLLSEGLQYLGLLSGTFDPLDMFTYTLAALLVGCSNIFHLSLKHQNL